MTPCFRNDQETAGAVLGVVATALVLALGVLGAASLGAQELETLDFVNGRWFDGKSFQEGRYYSVEGVLRSETDDAADRTIDLEGAWVVPAFGEAHNHNIADADGLDGTLRRYLREGVFYGESRSPSAATTS